MDIPVIIHDRRTRSKIQIQIRIDESDTIRVVEDKIAKAAKLNAGQLSVLLCGKVLEQDTSIKDLLLGPTTALVALAVETIQDKTVKDESLTPRTPNVGSFYVYCKTCEDIERVLRDPAGWDDVLKSKVIELKCEDCEQQSFATFKFKCIKCSEVCAPLSQVRGNWENSECCVCLDDTQLFVFDFGCNHSICRQCFVEYCSTSLADGKFRFRSPYGYTLGCPSLNCDYCLRDVHHLRALGAEKYKQYQIVATEKLIALDEQGFFCPFPTCGMSFIWESDNDAFISCPECLRRFCRQCKSVTCECLNEDETKRTIVATTKKCPGCHTDTERNGGCAHMQCTSCGLNWCFRCVKPWSDECQWDHWFD
ncbi:unnamed protein product [Auanema sp. JU1783]|nr:unnamed protein product [Auanema sp. JU1783]